MTYRFRNPQFLSLGLAVAVAVFAACGDDPVKVEDMHAEPEGAVLVIDSRTVASYDGDARTWTGQLEVGVGEESPAITVRFVDEDGDPVPIDDDLYLDVVVSDEQIADFHADDPGGFTGHLDGITEGQTSAAFRLMHGAVGSGHPDFETTPVPVRVTGRM